MWFRIGFFPLDGGRASMVLACSLAFLSQGPRPSSDLSLSYLIPDVFFSLILLNRCEDDESGALKKRGTGIG